MGAQYSIKSTSISASTAGSGNSITNLPQTNSTLVGVALNIGAVAINLDASRFSIVPGSMGAANVGQMVHVNIPIKGSTLNFNAYHKATTTTGVGYFYFGTPRSGALTAEQLAGVVVVQAYDNTGASAADVAETLTFNFPSGKISLVGLSMVWDSATAQAYYDTTFATSSGYSMDIFTNVQGGSWSFNQQVIALEGVLSATTLSVTSTAKSVTATTTVNALTIVYYSGGTTSGNQFSVPN
ncbi:MAG: hypothetical protein ACYCO0_05295 [Candidatus Micrarchaeaceae archaeon]